jgi:4a-hydroxytetrahydrobiopterin dehydratase
VAERSTAERFAPEQFMALDGLEDWRVLAWGASAFFAGGLADGARLVEKVAEVERPAPEVDVRPDGVTVRLPQRDAGLTEDHVRAARHISGAARELGMTADPTAVQDVNFVIDALVAADVMPFWRAVLGYEEFGDEDLVDPHWRAAPIWFQDMDAPRPQRNRIHVDVFVPHDQAEARVAAAVAAGGRVLRHTTTPTGWLLADPEGNEVDVATCLGRG